MNVGKGYLTLLKRSARKADKAVVYIAGAFVDGENTGGHYKTVKLPRIKKEPPKHTEPLTREQHIEAAKKELEEMIRKMND